MVRMIKITKIGCKCAFFYLLIVIGCVEYPRRLIEKGLYGVWRLPVYFGLVFYRG